MAGPDYVGQFQQQDLGDFTDQYNTPVPPEKQPAFNQWVAAQTQATGKNPLHDRYDYDVTGDWLAGAGRDERGHGSDQFKKPNHPTFSDQSQYHGKDGYAGGHWNTDPQGQYTSYTPSHTNLSFRSPEELQQYFKQVEPNLALTPQGYRAQPARTPAQAPPPASRKSYGQ
jgi:hypothetical protein